jgi:hypothetical protein
MKTSQFSLLFLLLFLTILIFQILLICYSIKYIPSLLITAPTFLVVFILFYRLDIEVDNKIIRISFGIGLIKKTFNINTIESVRVVKNSPLVGFGIRNTLNYTLYNVSGLNAIELSFKNKSHKVRIGSRQSNELCSYISQFL